MIHKIHVLLGLPLPQSMAAACTGWPRLRVIRNVCMATAGLSPLHHRPLALFAVRPVPCSHSTTSTLCAVRWSQYLRLLDTGIRDIWTDCRGWVGECSLCASALSCGAHTVHDLSARFPSTRAPASHEETAMRVICLSTRRSRPKQRRPNLITLHRTTPHPLSL